jgi:hypothetical protein
MSVHVPNRHNILYFWFRIFLRGGGRSTEILRSNINIYISCQQASRLQLCRSFEGTLSLFFYPHVWCRMLIEGRVDFCSNFLFDIFCSNFLSEFFLRIFCPNFSSEFFVRKILLRRKRFLWLMYTWILLRNAKKTYCPKLRLDIVC